MHALSPWTHCELVMMRLYVLDRFLKSKILDVKHGPMSAFQFWMRYVHGSYLRHNFHYFIRFKYHSVSCQLELFCSIRQYRKLHTMATVNTVFHVHPSPFISLVWNRSNMVKSSWFRVFNCLDQYFKFSRFSIFLSVNLLFRYLCHQHFVCITLFC